MKKLSKAQTKIMGKFRVEPTGVTRAFNTTYALERKGLLEPATQGVWAKLSRYNGRETVTMAERVDRHRLSAAGWEYLELEPVTLNDLLAREVPWWSGKVHTHMHIPLAGACPELVASLEAELMRQGRQPMRCIKDPVTGIDIDNGIWIEHQPKETE